MHYLYHMVPPDQKGTVLRPLNELKKTDLELYKKKVQKYAGREHIMQHPIPPLGCLWNDVIHLSPVEPHDLKKALLESGMDKDRVFQFYKIDPTILELEKTAVFLFKKTAKIKHIPEDEFAPFNPEQLKEFKQIPTKTKEYFTESYKEGRNPLLFVGIPHILYKGSIDVSKVEIMTV